MNLVSAFEMISPSGHPSFKRRGNLYDCISANYIDFSLKLILMLTAMPRMRETKQPQTPGTKAIRINHLTTAFKPL